MTAQNTELVAEALEAADYLDAFDARRKEKGHAAYPAIPASLANKTVQGTIREMAAALEAATPRVVSTVAELDALPHGSVIRCDIAGQAGLVIGTKSPRDFYMAGRRGALPADAVQLPATVLWLPEGVVEGE